MSFEPEISEDLFDEEECECGGECLCDLDDFDDEELEELEDDELDEEWEEEDND